MRVLTAIPPVAMTLLAVWQVGLGHKWGRQPMSNASLIGWSIILWLIYLRLMSVKLITQLFPGELRVAMKGLWRSYRIALSAVDSVSVVEIDAIRDWGGYGVRHSKRGTAYLAEAKQGVELRMSKGSILVIGSGRAGELAQRIRQALLA